MNALQFRAGHAQGVAETATAKRRPPCDMKAYPMDPPGYAARVRQLEREGLTTSDAQGVADAEFK